MANAWTALKRFGEGMGEGFTKGYSQAQEADLDAKIKIKDAVSKREFELSKEGYGDEISKASYKSLPDSDKLAQLNIIANKAGASTRLQNTIEMQTKAEQYAAEHNGMYPEGYNPVKTAKDLSGDIKTYGAIEGVIKNKDKQFEFNGVKDEVERITKTSSELETFLNSTSLTPGDQYEFYKKNMVKEYDDIVKTRSKITGKKEEERSQTQEAIGEEMLFLKQVDRSSAELSKKFPGYGDVGFEGKLTRVQAHISTYFDELPETSVLQREIKPKANAFARKIEGGRVTDQDRQIYADAMVNTINAPITANARLASNQLLRMKGKGGDVTQVVDMLLQAKTPMLRLIAQQVIEESPELYERVK